MRPISLAVNVFPLRILSMLLAGALACGTAGAVPAPLDILVEDAAGPWSNHDGSGYANDLVRAAFEAAGAQVKLTVVPYARCKARVMQGSAAACMNMSAAPELDGLVQFGEQPLFRVYPRFYDSLARPVRAASPRDFAPGTRLGVVNSYEYPPSIAALAARGVILDATDSDVTNLRKLDIGRVDVALIMTDDLRSEALIERQAGVRNVHFMMQGAAQGSYIGFSLRHPDGERARTLFNMGYRKISANGTRARIDAAWRRRCADGCGQ